LQGFEGVLLINNSLCIILRNFLDNPFEGAFLDKQFGCFLDFLDFANTYSATLEFVLLTCLFVIPPTESEDPEAELIIDSGS